MRSKWMNLDLKKRCFFVCRSIQKYFWIACILALSLNITKASLNQLDPTFLNHMQIQGQIKTVVVQTDGKILVGGNFTSIQGVNITGLARLNADGTLDNSFQVGSGINYPTLIPSVEKIEIQSNGKILLIGNLIEYNGISTSSYFIRLNQNGTLDNSFQLNFSGSFYAPIHTFEIVVLPNDKILMAVRNIGGTGQNGIIRLNSNGSIDNTFNNGNLGIYQTNLYTGVYRILPLDNGKIIIAGSFDSYNGTPKNCIARLNSDGTLDNSFINNPGLIDPDFMDINSLETDENGSIYFSGVFFNCILNNSPYPEWLVVKLDQNGAYITNFSNQAQLYNSNTIIWDVIYIGNDKLLMCGNFDTYSSQSSEGLVRTNLDGTIDLNFPINLNFLANPYSVPNWNLMTRYENDKVIVSSGNEIIRLGGCDPDILSQPQDEICSNSASFSIAASGYGSPVNFQWYNAANNNPISGATNSTFNTSVQGDYYCIVSNSCNSVTSQTVSFTKIKPISIISQPQDQLCQNSATFTVNASSTDPLTYAWKLANGNPAPGINNGLSYSTSTPGLYYCEISNSCAAVNTNTVEFSFPNFVDIITHPISQSVCSGKNVSFSVSASGNGLQYQWKKNGVDIPGANSSTFTINNVKSASQGSYSCLVTENICEIYQDLSGSAVLSLLPETKINSLLNNYEVCSGENITFSANVSGSNLTYKWRKFGSKPILGTGSTFTINNAQTHNSGIYTLEVTGSCGSASAQIANLTVNNWPITINSQTADIYCFDEYSTATLTVNASSPSPGLNYAWTWNNAELGSTSNSVTIFNIGTYVCTISNGCEEVSVTFYVSEDPQTPELPCEEFRMGKFDLKSNISIFPNPAKGELNIALSEIHVNRINLIDNMGRSFEITENTSGLVKVDLTAFAPGIYYLEIISDQGRELEKVIIQH